MARTVLSQDLCSLVTQQKCVRDRKTDGQMGSLTLAVASERYQHCAGKVSSKPEGLRRDGALGMGDKPLPTRVT